MERRQQIGRYLRLEHELIEAYTSQSCESGLIERLTDELAATRHQIRDVQRDDEQSGDSTVPGAISA